MGWPTAAVSPVRTCTSSTSLGSRARSSNRPTRWRCTSALARAASARSLASEISCRRAPFFAARNARERGLRFVQRRARRRLAREQLARPIGLRALELLVRARGVEAGLERAPVLGPRAGAHQRELRLGRAPLRLAGRQRALLERRIDARDQPARVEAIPLVNDQLAHAAAHLEAEIALLVLDDALIGLRVRIAPLAGRELHRDQRADEQLPSRHHGGQDAPDPAVASIAARRTFESSSTVTGTSPAASATTASGAGKLVT
jgi:hypothetical protein